MFDTVMHWRPML